MPSPQAPLTASPPLHARDYQSEADLTAMLDLLMSARALTRDWRYPHVGELLWDFFMIACHLDPLEHIRLWHDDEGVLVAYALLSEDPTFDCQVLPGYNGAGIEVEALAWADKLLGRLQEQDYERWGRALLSWVRQDDAARVAYLQRHDFSPGPYAEVNLLRLLDGPIPPPDPPPGWQVRPVAADEIPQRAAIQRVVWHPWTVSNVSDQDYLAFVRLPGFQPALDLVAVNQDGVVASYLNGWIDPVNRIADIGPVGALPDYRRRGLTRAVLLEGLRRMHALGMNRVCISTGVENIAARNLYESIGFRVENEYHQYIRHDPTL